ncbi:hypothetical protein OAW29_03115 [Planktomarina temperata]|nr:hypothetical protein [Planktomarina temperata]
MEIDKKILIVIPELYSLHNAYEFEEPICDVFTYLENDAFKQNILQKLLVKFCNTLSIEQYGTRIQYLSRQHSRSIIERIQNEDYDILLIFKGVGIRQTDLIEMRRYVKKVYLFLWDPLRRYPFVKNTFSYYDQVFTCQYTDVSSDNITFEPVHFSHVEPLDSSIVTDAVFVGKYTSSRLKMMRSLETTDLEIYYKLVNRGDGSVARNEWLGLVKNSKLVLDLGEEDQTQWTARLVDGLCMGKQVVTTSTEIDALPKMLQKRIHTVDSFMRAGRSIIQKDISDTEIKELTMIAREFFSATRFLARLR